MVDTTTTSGRSDMRSTLLSLLSHPPTCSQYCSTALLLLLGPSPPNAQHISTLTSTRRFSPRPRLPPLRLSVSPLSRVSTPSAPLTRAWPPSLLPPPPLHLSSPSPPSPNPSPSPRPPRSPSPPLPTPRPSSPPPTSLRPPPLPHRPTSTPHRLQPAPVRRSEDDPPSNKDLPCPFVPPRNSTSTPIPS